MSETYLVVGGVGFIGSFLADELLESGDDVVLFDVRRSHPLLELLGVEDEVRTHSGDVTHLPDLLRAVAEYDPDYVVHLAAMLSGIERSPWRAQEVNCTGTTNVFEAARTGSVRRVVWTSSTSVYADADRYPDAPNPVVDEDSLVDPPSLYGAQKYLNEKTAAAYHEHHGLDVVGLRPPGIYGPHKSAPEPHNDLIEAGIAGEPMTVPYGDQRVELVYVRDVARALVRACLAADPSRTIYNVGADFLTYREMVETVTEIVGGEFSVTSDARMNWTHDVDWERARTNLGYEPAYSFADGVADFHRLVG